jgi:hypothetical protein
LKFIKDLEKREAFLFSNQIWSETETSF